MAQAEGIKIKGEHVESMEDRTFFIIKEPVYQEEPGYENPEETQRKLCIRVRIADGAELDYNPNQTSINMMVAQYGFEMNKWVGHRFKWEVVKQNAFGKMQSILYVSAEKLNDVLPKEL